MKLDEDTGMDNRAMLICERASLAGNAQVNAADPAQPVARGVDGGRRANDHGQPHRRWHAALRLENAR